MFKVYATKKINIIYLPFIEKKNVLFPNAYNSEFHGACDFILRIYSFCFQTIRFFYKNGNYNNSCTISAYTNDNTLERG